MNRIMTSFVVGFLFALGLGISGMTKPQAVQGFLDLFGQWDYSLLGVKGGAILTHGILYRLIMKRSSPLFDTKFHVPSKKEIDPRLVFGAALFGIGWGWAGMCPGPSLVSLATGNIQVITFVVSMLLGMGVFKLVEPKL